MATTLLFAILSSALLSIASSPPPLPHFRAHIPHTHSLHAIRSSHPTPPSHLHPRSSLTALYHRRLPSRTAIHHSASQGEWPVRGEDTLLWTLDLEDGGEQVTLLLRPNWELLHPEAKIDYGSGRKEALRIGQDDVRVYEGYVLDPSPSSSHLDSLLAGLDPPSTGGGDYARLVLHPDSPADGDVHDLVFDGIFTLRGEMHHVRSRDGWERSNARREGDPDESVWDGTTTVLQRRTGRSMTRRDGSRRSRSGTMVVLRDRDLVLPNRRQANANADDPARSCGHDELHAVNTDAALNPVLFAGSLPHPEEPFSPWLNDPYHVFSRERDAGLSLGRRQDGLGNSNMTSNFAGSIGSTSGCPTERRVVYLGVAADCTYVNHYTTQDAARTQILTNMNSASALYSSTFNVALGVIELSVQSPVCPSSPPSSEPWNIGCPESGPSGLDLNSRLSVFSRWRGNKGGADGAGLWHLMTNCSTGSEVGVAWLGQLCRVEATTLNAGGNSGQTSSGTGVTAITRSEWQVVAHEIGHNFGAIHDCTTGCSLTQACCPLTTSTCNANNNYIMSPVSTRNVSTFSPCSIGNVCSVLRGTLNTTCLVSPGSRRTIALQQCGNGIIDPGEECDPGTNSNSTCCDAATCRLRQGAVCDPDSSACCTDQCAFASQGTVCRPAADQRCDTQEVCSGTEASCPEDKHANDGDECGDGGLKCASGQCTSRDEQCRAQGSSLGISAACDSRVSNECLVTCQAPGGGGGGGLLGGGGQCVVLDSNFIDGTPCGYAGFCRSGNCDQGSWDAVFRAWYVANPQISVPVTIVIGIIVLLILAGCVRGCIGKRRRKKMTASGNYETFERIERGTAAAEGVLRAADREWECVRAAARPAAAERRHGSERTGAASSSAEE